MVNNHWLVVFKHGFDWSISYMGCHPSHWRTHIFQDGYCTTNIAGKILQKYFVAFSSREPFDKMVDVHMIFPSLFINHQYLIIIYWYSTGLWWWWLNRMINRWWLIFYWLMIVIIIYWFVMMVIFPWKAPVSWSLPAAVIKTPRRIPRPWPERDRASWTTRQGCQATVLGSWRCQKCRKITIQNWDRLGFHQWISRGYPKIQCFNHGSLGRFSVPYAGWQRQIWFIWRHVWHGGFLEWG